MKLKRIRYIEPNYIRNIQSSIDPDFFFQWSLNNTGQKVNAISGSIDVDIDWLEAMQIYTPKTPIVVAVIDTGVAGSNPVSHPSDLII